MTDPTHCPVSPDDLDELRAEAPGPDGIRRRFVERIRERIAAGYYDDPDRWGLAEELLMRSAEDR